MMDTREMRRLVAPSLMGFMLAACGGGDAPAEGEQAEGGEPAGATIEHPVDAGTAGSINGTVKFTGTAPAAAPIDMADEPTCAEGQGAQAVSHEVVVDGAGNLANVFVYVKSGLDPALAFPTGEGVVLDQENCEYRPHVLALSSGQQLTVRNSDAVLHNINATPTANRGFNRSQPQEGMEFQTTFTESEVMIPVRCDVHGWMQAFVGVTPHPYHAVTGDNGGFTLDRLPPGTYELEAWHEKYGTQTQSVTVAQGAPTEVTFTFDASMAGRPVPMGPALVVDHHTHSLRRVQQ